MNDRRRLLRVVLLAALAAVPLAAYALVFKPRNEEIARAKTEIAEKEARLVGLRELTREIGDLGREIDARNAELARLSERLPDHESLDGLLKDVNRIAREAALTVRTVRGDRPVPAGPAREIPLHLVMEGGFLDFYRFLTELEALPRITRVRTLKVAALGDDPHASRAAGPGSGDVRVELTLSVYASESATAATASGGAK